MAKLGATRVSDLNDVPADVLRNTAESLRAQWAPVMDGERLPVHPFDPTPAPTALDIPILIGTCRDESALFLAGDPQRQVEPPDQIGQEHQATGEHADNRDGLAVVGALNLGGDLIDPFLDAIGGDENGDVRSRHRRASGMGVAFIQLDIARRRKWIIRSISERTCRRAKIVRKE